LKTAKETGGQLLEIESTYDNISKEPAPHYHPYQEDNLVVLEGELTAKIDGVVRVLTKGQTLDILPNTVPSMWSSYGKKTIVNWKVSPAMDTEFFLENTMGLASDGKTDEAGMPGLLQVALLANIFSYIFRLSKPPYFIQKIVFSLLTPFAYFKGLKPFYEKYQN